jgi:hypothetical protein
VSADGAVGEHGLEVTANRGGGQRQRYGQVGRRGGPVLEQGTGDAIAGAAVDRFESHTSAFHNTILA